RQVVPAILPWDETRLRLIIQQMQTLVAREKIHERRFRHRPTTHALEKVECVANRVDDALIGVLQRRVLYESQVPIFRMVEVSETTIDKRTHKVERKCGAFITAQEQVRIGGARLSREFRAVNQIAAITRQSHTVSSLGVHRARLGILPRHAPYSDDRLLQSVQQHETHLKKNLQLFGDRVRFAISERFGAITALQQEGLPALGGG